MEAGREVGCGFGSVEANVMEGGGRHAYLGERGKVVQVVQGAGCRVQGAEVRVQG